MIEPVGSLCVLPTADHSHWTVGICEGSGKRKVLRRFTSREQAAEFAIEYRAQNTQWRKQDMKIQFPDDCPCSENHLTW